jgi:hypothetical protein
MKTNTRIIIAIIIFNISLYFLGWWGFLSLIVLLPFVGWNDKHKGPFLYTRKGVTDFRKSDILFKKYLESHRVLQDLLVRISKEKEPYNMNIQQDLEILFKKLKSEEYEQESSDREILIGFLNEFADAFPNWIPEYKYIHSFIIKEFKNKGLSEEKKKEFQKLFVEALREQKRFKMKNQKSRMVILLLFMCVSFAGD